MSINHSYQLTRRAAWAAGVAVALAVASCSGGAPTATPTRAPTAVYATPAPDATLAPCDGQAAPGALDALHEFPGTLYYSVPEHVLAVTGDPPAVQTAFDKPSSDYVLDGLSPDGQWFLSGTFPGDGGRPDPLTLRSVDGTVLAHTVVITRAWPDDNWVFSGWITDNLLLVHRVDQSLKRQFPYVVGLYDPQAAAWRTDLLDELPDRDVVGAVAISPDLTRAVYVTGGEGQYSLVLWDYTQHRALWQRADFATLSIVEGTRVGNFPLVWSADSAQVAFTDWGNQANEFVGQTFVLDREGKEARGITTPRLGDLVNGLAWSPNGRYLAGITSIQGAATNSFVVVYDTLTMQGVDLCPVDGAALNAAAGGRLIWSPDSRYVAYGSHQDLVTDANGGTQDNPDAGLVIEDIYSGEVTTIATGHDAKLVGWSSYTK